MNKDKFKSYLLLSAFTVCLYVALNNLPALSQAFNHILGLLSPFIGGLVIAFILSGPADLFEKFFTRSKSAFVQKKSRFLAVTATLLLAVIILLIISFTIIPQTIESIGILVQNMPGYLNDSRDLFSDLLEHFKIPQDILTDIETKGQEYTKTILNSLGTILPQLAAQVMSIGSNVINLFIAFVVSIHLLYNKKQMVNQVRRMVFAFFPEKVATVAASITRTVVDIFRKYITGQLTDALIVGLTSIIGLNIFHFPYATLVGMFMGITNIIPFFGPFIGAIPSFFIILMVNPKMALWYIVFVLVIQQIDGNIIAPKVIGGKMGLPPLWVLVGVTLGGAIWGPVGLILGTPLMAIVYSLLKQFTASREKSKLEAVNEEQVIPALPPPSEENN